jgi:hypothetical protein
MAKPGTVILIVAALIAGVSAVPAQDNAIPLELGPGVANVGGEYAPAAGHLVGNVVVLSGVIRPGTGVLAVLPVNLRPPARLIFLAPTHGGVARVDVLPDGKVVVVSGGNAAWISLSGISFALR